MTTVKTRKIKSGLQSKGFNIEEKDHTYLYFVVDGKKQGPSTQISHGVSEYSDSLLSKMVRQLSLDNKRQLIDLIKCPLSMEEYQEIIDSEDSLPVVSHG